MASADPNERTSANSTWLRELGWLDAMRAQRLPRMPVVMSREEVRAVLRQVEGPVGLFALLAELLYGTGMRIEECCSFRVKDVDLGRGQLVVFGKGNKDRVVMLPEKVHPALKERLASRACLHERDVQRRGLGRAPGRTHAQVPECLSGTRLAIRLRVASVVAGPAERPDRPASRIRGCPVSRHHGRRAALPR
jgi:integrase